MLLMPNPFTKVGCQCRMILQIFQFPVSEHVLFMADDRGTFGCWCSTIAEKSTEKVQEVIWHLTELESNPAPQFAKTKRDFWFDFDCFCWILLNIYVFVLLLVLEHMICSRAKRSFLDLISSLAYMTHCQSQRTDRYWLKYLRFWGCFRQ